MNTRKADEFFKAFELANDQGTVSWEMQASVQMDESNTQGIFEDGNAQSGIGASVHVSRPVGTCC
jgi:hypothetical protein